VKIIDFGTAKEFEPTEKVGNKRNFFHLLGLIALAPTHMNKKVRKVGE
jgi:hypothetical protein